MSKFSISISGQERVFKLILLQGDCYTFEVYILQNSTSLVLGIVAGIWPCGKITLIGELFRSKSLSQVYGFLHTFVFENGDSLKNMSRWLLLDTN